MYLEEKCGVGNEGHEKTWEKAVHDVVAVEPLQLERDDEEGVVVNTWAALDLLFFFTKIWLSPLG